MAAGKLNATYAIYSSNPDPRIPRFTCVQNVVRSIGNSRTLSIGRFTPTLFSAAVEGDREWSLNGKSLLNRERMLMMPLHAWNLDE